MLTTWIEPSSQPVTARVESELIAKHVNPAVWYGWPRRQNESKLQSKDQKKITIICFKFLLKIDRTARFQRQQFSLSLPVNRPTLTKIRTVQIGASTMIGERTFDKLW